MQDGKATGTWAEIPVALLTCDLTLYKLLHLTDPQFSHMWNGTTMTVDRINKITQGRVLKAKLQRAGNLPSLLLNTPVLRSQQYTLAKSK